MIVVLGVDFLTAGIGNIHGIYPFDLKGLHFDTFKININTDCHLVFAKATKEYFLYGGIDPVKKGYDPRKLLKSGLKAICAKFEEKIKFLVVKKANYKIDIKRAY